MTNGDIEGSVNMRAIGLTLALIFFAILGLGRTTLGQEPSPEPPCTMALVLAADSIPAGEALDVSVMFYLNKPRGGVGFFNPFLDERFPVPARLRVYDEKGTLIGDLLPPIPASKPDIPPKTAWQYFSRGDLVGRRWVFQPNSEDQATAFLYRPGRYRIQFQALKQMFIRSNYTEGKLAFERKAEWWRQENFTSVSMESGFVPFEVTPPRGRPVVPDDKAEASPYGLRLRIAKSLGEQIASNGEVFYWVENTAEKPRILGALNGYSISPIHWAYQNGLDPLRPLSSSMIYSGEPQEYSMMYVELPTHGIWGTSSKEPFRWNIPIGAELYAELRGTALYGPNEEQDVQRMLQRGRVTPEGLVNCQKLKNTDVIATSNRLRW